MNVIKKICFLSLIFFIFHSYSVITFQQKVTIENSLEADNIIVSASKLAGNLFFTPVLLTIGNDIQQTNFYIYGLQNNDTGSYLVLDEYDMLGVFTQSRKNNVYGADVYPEIRTNIINSNNEAHALSINGNNGSTQIGTLPHNDINIIGKTIFITGKVGSSSLTGITIKPATVFNSDLSINGALRLQNDSLIINGNLYIKSLLGKNVGFTVDIFKFSSPSYVADINVIPTDNMTIQSLFLSDCPSFDNGIPHIVFGMDGFKVIGVASLPSLRAEKISNKNTDLAIVVNDTFFIKNNLSIGKSITFKKANTSLVIDGSGIITFPNEIVFKGDPYMSININDMIINSLINVDTLILDNVDQPFILNPDVVVSESMIFKNNLTKTAGTKLVVNNDPQKGWGRLMKSAGSSKNYKENIENFVLSKELFLDLVEPCFVEEKGEKIFFINPDKLEKTFLENIFQNNENEIVFNNKELLALFLTQFFTLHDEINLLNEYFSVF